jgi:hypothetical protein
MTEIDKVVRALDLQITAPLENKRGIETDPGEEETLLQEMTGCPHTWRIQADPPYPMTEWV